MPLEGGEKPRVVGQLAEAGDALRVVHPILCCLSDYSLLYGRSVEDFGTGPCTENDMQHCADVSNCIPSQAQGIHTDGIRFHLSLTY